MAPHCTFSRCFNRDDTGGVSKMTVSPMARPHRSASRSTSINRRRATMQTPASAPSPARPSRVRAQRPLHSHIRGLQSLMCGLQSHMCGLQSPTCGLQSPTCGLQSLMCGLQSPTCGLQSPICGAYHHDDHHYHHYHHHHVVYSRAQSPTVAHMWPTVAHSRLQSHTCVRAARAHLHPQSAVCETVTLLHRPPPLVYLRQVFQQG